MKEQFLNAGELIKFYYFEIPPLTKYDLTVTIKPLTPYFKPLVFVKQVDYAQTDPIDYSTVDYPNILENEASYGLSTYNIIDQSDVSYFF